MPVRFAVSSTNWSNPATWDDGIGPVAGDTVHPNGFTVTIDTDISVASLNNNISPVYLPKMPIPKMTGNTQPSGTVNAGSDTTNAWKGFDQDAPSPTTFWSGTGVAAVNSTAWLSYQFTSTKIIKRYYIFRTSQNQKPTSWIFQGSNNGSIWDDLETVTANALTTPYLSPILPNTTAYLYYRINVTAVTSGTTANIYQFEMTESTATTYGITTGGSFTIPASLSGTRNIIFNGEGIRTVSTNALVLVSNLIGSTVNFNVISGGYIINTNWLNVSGNFYKGFELNGTGAVNFNSNLYGSTNGNQTDSGGAIHVNGTPTITINGNIYGGTGTTAQNHFIFFKLTTSNNSILNHNGDNIASGNNSTFSNIFIASNPIINITGNLTGNLGCCINSLATSSPTITLIGTATVTNLNSQASIILTSLSSLLTINGSITNKNNVNAILAAKIRFASTATPYWIYQTNAGTDMTLSYGSAIGEFPVESDVRVGVQYAAAPIRTGTCAVPLPQYVSQGVPTGSTVGTAYLNAADVWNILTSTITTPGSVGKLISDNLNETVSSRASQTSVDTANTNINNLPGNTADAVWNEATSGITTAGSIGERLKNASTVQTNGDQLAAYIV